MIDISNSLGQSFENTCECLKLPSGMCKDTFNICSASKLCTVWFVQTATKIKMIVPREGRSKATHLPCLVATVCTVHMFVKGLLKAFVRAFPLDFIVEF